jgi:hypothetical protein
MWFIDEYLEQRPAAGEAIKRPPKQTGSLALEAFCVLGFSLFAEAGCLNPVYRYRLAR